MKKTIGMLLLSGFMQTVYGLAPQTPDQTVASIEVDSRFSPAQVLVYVNESIPNPEGCTNSHRYAFSLDESGKSFLSMLLAAQATGKPVRFNTDLCQDGVPKIKIMRSF